LGGTFPYDQKGSGKGDVAEKRRKILLKKKRRLSYPVPQEKKLTVAPPQRERKEPDQPKEKEYLRYQTAKKAKQKIFSTKKARANGGGRSAIWPFFEGGILYGLRKEGCGRKSDRGWRTGEGRKYSYTGRKKIAVLGGKGCSTGGGGRAGLKKKGVRADGWGDKEEPQHKKKKRAEHNCGKGERVDTFQKKERILEGGGGGVGDQKEGMRRFLGKGSALVFTLRGNVRSDGREGKSIDTEKKKGCI